MRAPDKRGRRVAFERAIPASMMAIDGTWQRACTLQDVSDSGAKLLIEGSVESLPLNKSSWCSRRPALPIAGASWRG